MSSPTATILTALAAYSFDAEHCHPRTDLTRSIELFIDAYTTLTRSHVLQRACTRLATRALQLVGAAERKFTTASAHAETSYTGYSVFKLQSVMQALAKFSRDHRTVEHLDLALSSLPAAQRTIDGLNERLGATIEYYALRKLSTLTWAAEDLQDRDSIKQEHATSPLRPSMSKRTSHASSLASPFPTRPVLSSYSSYPTPGNPVRPSLPPKSSLRAVSSSSTTTQSTVNSSGSSILSHSESSYSNPTSESDDTSADEALPRFPAKSSIRSPSITAPLFTRNTTAAARPVRVLSLDCATPTAGLRCLFTLKSAMASITHVAPVPRPCDYFDLISSSGCGGVAAILLGRLRYSVEDAIRSYVDIFSGADAAAPAAPGGWKGLLAGPSKSAVEDKSIEELLREWIPALGLQDDGARGEEREGATAILAYERKAAGTLVPTWFRSYTSTSDTRLTLRQIALATLASSEHAPAYTHYGPAPAHSTSPAQATLAEVYLSFPTSQIEQFVTLSAQPLSRSSSPRSDALVERAEREGWSTKLMQIQFSSDRHQGRQSAAEVRREFVDIARTWDW